MAATIRGRTLLTMGDGRSTQRIARGFRRLAGVNGGHGPSRALGRLAVLAVLTPLLVSPGSQPAADDPATHVADDHGHASVPDERGGPGARQVGASGQRALDTRPAVAQQVDTHQPHLLVRPDGELDPEGLFGLLALPGVEHVASAVELDARMESDDVVADLELLIVDASAFRPLTPDATAQSVAVWERLVDGELVIRHDIAQEHQLPLGGTVLLTGEDGQQHEVRIGAFASNGSPPFAEAVLPWSVGRALGAESPNLVIVSLGDDGDTDAVSDRISDVVAGSSVEAIEPPSEEQSRMVGAGAHRFESFSYVSHGDGMITIDPDWVRRNIVTVELPVFGGTARCHRAMVPQLVAALREVEAAGLDRYIDVRQYGGCWVPRHILFEPHRPLSMHAWGLAIDFNVSTNQYGAQPQMHPDIVEIFERWGFRWGGRWSTPDGMHFELETVVQP